MSNAIKWALLTAGAVLLVGLVLALPFVDVINFGELSGAVSNLISVSGGALQSAKGIVNCFLSPWARGVLTGVIYYEIAKFAITISIKITTWVYHFIFRG